MERPRDVLERIRVIPGVVEVGLFLDLADIVIVEDGDGVELLERAPGTRIAPVNLVLRG